MVANSTYRFVTDQLGSVRAVVDVATGSIVQQIDYDAWGLVLSDTNPGFQPFGFAGGLWDGQTGLVRFGARDYDAEVGRWTVKDPVGFDGGQENLHEYVGGDPVNQLDSEGELPNNPKIDHACEACLAPREKSRRECKQRCPSGEDQCVPEADLTNCKEICECEVVRDAGEQCVESGPCAGQITCSYPSFWKKYGIP